MRTGVRPWSRWVRAQAGFRRRDGRSTDANRRLAEELGGGRRPAGVLRGVRLRGGRRLTQAENQLKDIVKGDDPDLASRAVQDDGEALSGALHLAQGAFLAHLGIEEERRL